MHYTLSYKNPSRHLLDITFTIPDVNAATVCVQLPAWRPGRYELGNFAQNIKTFNPKDSSGKPLSFKKITKDRWEIETNKTKTVYIDYSYYANELNAGSTFLDASQLYVNGVNCLLYVPERMEEPCTLELKLPKNYSVATGLKKNTAHKFTAKDYHELVDCPLIASASLQRNTYSVNGVQFNIWFHGECKPWWKKILSDFKKFTKAHYQLFGNFPFKEYHFLFQIVPTAFYHGVEHTNSTVIALGPSYAIMNEKYNDLLGVSSHELFHAWNIKTIRPLEMMPYDYSKENYSRLGFVAEGVTTYYGDLMLLRSGVFSVDAYLGELNKTLDRHFNNPGRLNLSVADSSFDTWLDGYKQGVPGRKSSIYVEGALCAFMLDINIRKQTKNKKSLDDVMRLLNENFGKKGKGYSETDYRDAVNAIAGAPLNQILDDYIYGTKSFDSELRNCFDYLGFEFRKSVPASFIEAVLGFKMQSNGDKNIVGSVHPDSPAEKAGLALQDEIIAVNNLRVDGNTEFWCSYFSTEKLTFIVSTNSRIREITIVPDGNEYYVNYAVSKSEVMTKAQENNFNSWAGVS